LSYFRPYGNPAKFIAGMITHFNRLRDEDITPNEYFHWVKSKIQNSKSKTNSKLKKSNEENELEDYDKYLELANAYRTYEELKVKEGVCDYADLINHTLKIFRTRPNILTRYRGQFKYILIDEFQDTNYAQNELAILLSGSPRGEAGAKKNITVVGDDDQAIYRWRGAAVSNMIQFKKTFPKAKIIVLTKNYRSTKEILDRSYNVMQKK
jgi:DNA helicase-2/ATP-dependent DNA helicase PcrA